jgi:alanine racemase
VSRIDTDGRVVWSEVDLDAVRANVAALRALAAPAALLAVVKANGYGHGAVPVARAALAAGAEWLGVARVEEGEQLRDAAIDAPVMLLSEPAPGVAERVVAAALTPVVYSELGIDALAKAVADAGGPPLDVHLKIDTGMHRVGCAPDDALALAQLIDARDELVLAGVCTHLAVADEPDHPYTAEQLARFDAARAALESAGLHPALAHAANSAGLLAQPAARYDLVRIGIACYGLSPSPALADHEPTLRPAMSLRARITLVKELPDGARVSYGLRGEVGSTGRIATVAAGYADGVPRNLGLRGGEVLVAGVRRPIVGAVTMDQLLVDLDDAPAAVGDEVVLIGRQGDDEITATEWANLLGTIAYEIVTGIGARVPRTYTGEVG